MKIARLAVALVSCLLLVNCGPGSASSENGSDSVEGWTAQGDSIGILGYTTSGELDKPVPAREDATSGSITIAVDETLQPVIDAEIAAFEFLFEEAEIHAVYLPGEEAIAAMLSSDSIRMAISTRELRPEEEAILGQRGVAAKYAHLFSDGVAVIAHPDRQSLTLTNDQLTSLLNGEVDNWSQLGSSAGSLSMVVDDRASSVLMTLRTRYLEGEQVSSSSLYALDSIDQVFDYVANNPNAIGFVGNAWISDQDDADMKNRMSKVTLIPLEKSQGAENCTDGKNFFLPYQSYIYQGCYPLSRPVTSILRESTMGLGTGFVSFMDSPKGQIVIHKAGLATVHGIARRVKLPPKTELDQEPTNSDSE